MPIIDGNSKKTSSLLQKEAKTSSPDIVGEPFKDYVNNQITQRQKVHGSGFGGTRSQKDLVYLNSRNAWVKMASSVQISALGEDLAKENPDAIGFNQEMVDFQNEANAKLKRLGLNVENYQGIKLAQEGVLFNGITDNKTKIPKKGVSSTSSKINNSVYGFGGTKFGLQPMPGITSFNIGHNNIGSIRTAEVQIKAYNDFQFDLISILYIRLGFTMLIEWGNSMYLDNKGNLTKMGPTIIDDNQTGWFGQKGTSHLEMFNQIETKREQHNGNYDGFFGKITNFDFSFETDGSYSITLTLISMGDVVESFNLNTLNDEFLLPLGSERDVNNKLLNNNSILNKIFCLKNNLLNELDIPQPFDKEGNPNPDYKNQQSFLKSNTNKDFVVVRADTLNLDPPQLATLDPFYTPPTPKEIKYDDTFITFSYFLNLVNDLIGYIGNKSSFAPQLTINTSKKNYCKSIPKLVSFNPQVCVINNNIDLPEFTNTFKLFNPTLYEEEKNDPFLRNVITQNQQTYGPLEEIEFIEENFQISNLLVGRIMNIYLNVNYLEKQIQNKINGQGELLLFNLLDSICKDINISLANVTQLKPTLQDDNIVVIRDFNLDVKTGEDATRITKNSIPLEIYGVNTTNKNQSNFVKDFKFNTTISKNLANSMSIGATAGSSDISSYAKFFTNLNRGLIDRFKEYSLPKNPEFTLDCGVKTKKNKSSSYDPIGSAVSNLVGPLPDTLANNKGVSNISFGQGFRPSPGDFTDGIKKVKESIFSTYSQWYYNTFASQGQVTGLKERWKILLQSGFDVDEASVRANDDPGRKSLIYFDPSLANYQQGKNLFLNLLKILSGEGNPATDSLIGFIPMNVELTLDGISGIKIYNQLVFNSSHLPSGYPDNIELIVTGVDHFLVDNEWTTKIRTLTKPSSKNVDPKKDPVPELNTKIDQTGDGVGDPNFLPLGTPFLNMDDILDPQGQIPIFAPIEKDKGMFLSSIPQANRNIDGVISDHYGVDIAAKEGLKVYAVTEGTLRKPPPNPKGFGNNFVYIEEKRTINTPDQSTFETIIHIYGHMGSYREELVDTYVKPGTIIGTVGDDGSPGSFHLHYEVRKGSYSRNNSKFKGHKNPVLELNKAYNPTIFPNAQTPLPFNPASIFKF